MSFTVAIIPAKSNSRRLPNKNFLKLENKELFLYSVNCAKKTPLIDEIFVSSDSEKILKIAKSKNVKILKRDLKLCAEEITNFDVLLHIFNQLKEMGKEPEIIALLQPTTPFRYPENLNMMIKIFKENPYADSLITVKESKRIRGTISNKYWIPETNNKNNLQSTKIRYEATGHIILLRPRYTLEKNTLLGEKIISQDLPLNWPDIDIDTKEDWEFAESFIKNHPEGLS